jgi:hypothetical protein
MRCDTPSAHAGAAQRSLLQSLGCAVKTSGVRLFKQFRIKDTGKTFSWGECTLLILLTLLAAGLRFYKLGEWSYFIDEFHTLENTSEFFAMVDKRLFKPNTRAAFWVLTKISLDSFGESAFALRLFPAIFGVVTVPLIYFPIKRLFDKYVALSAVLIIAISPWHIYMSQMGRWYTLSFLTAFLALFSFYAFVEWGKKRHCFFYLALTYFGITLHLTGFFVPMIAVVYLLALLVLRRHYQTKNTKRLLVFLGFHAIVCLAYVPRFVKFINEWTELEELVGAWGSDFVLKALYHITPSVAVSAIVGLFLLAMFKDRRGLWLGIYCILPFIILSVFALLELNVSARYQLFTLPAVAIAAAFTITYVRGMLPQNRNLMFLALILLMILPSLQTDYLYFTSEHGYRHRTQEVFQYIKKRMTKDDQLIVAGVYPDHEERFYAEHLIRAERIDIDDRQLITSSTESIDLKKRAWIVTLGRALENPEGFRKWIAENAHLSAEFPTRRAVQDQTLKVYLYSP